jgi:hypothetical protein
MMVFRAYPDDFRGVRYAYVEVRIARTRAEMHKDMRYQTYEPTPCTEGRCSGVSVYAVPKGGKPARLTGKFALMWMNLEDLLKRPAEMIAHECTHAAMRHITNKRVDLNDMGGEEALCYVVGSLTQQINDRLHKAGMFA